MRPSQGFRGNRGKRVFISGEQASLSLHVFVSPLPLYRILGNRETRANLFQGETMNIRIHWGLDIGEQLRHFI